MKLTAHFSFRVQFLVFLYCFPTTFTYLRKIQYQESILIVNKLVLSFIFLGPLNPNIVFYKKYYSFVCIFIVRASTKNYLTVVGKNSHTAFISGSNRSVQGVYPQLCSKTLRNKLNFINNSTARTILVQTSLLCLLACLIVCKKSPFI